MRSLPPMLLWTPREDEAILESVIRNGMRWKFVALAFPGRSAASVRNRYLRIQRGAKMRSEGLCKNRCNTCARLHLLAIAPRDRNPSLRALAGGQIKLGHICTSPGRVGVSRVPASVGLSAAAYTVSTFGTPAPFDDNSKLLHSQCPVPARASFLTPPRASSPTPPASPLTTVATPPASPPVTVPTSPRSFVTPAHIAQFEAKVQAVDALQSLLSDSR